MGILVGSEIRGILKMDTWEDVLCDVKSFQQLRHEPRWDLWLSCEYVDAHDTCLCACSHYWMTLWKPTVEMWPLKNSKEDNTKCKQVQLGGNLESSISVEGNSWMKTNLNAVKQAQCLLVCLKNVATVQHHCLSVTLNSRIREYKGVRMNVPQNEEKNYTYLSVFFSRPTFHHK